MPELTCALKDRRTPRTAPASGFTFSSQPGSGVTPPTDYIDSTWVTIPNSALSAGWNTLESLGLSPRPTPCRWRCGCCYPATPRRRTSTTSTPCRCVSAAAHLRWCAHRHPHRPSDAIRFGELRWRRNPIGYCHTGIHSIHGREHRHLPTVLSRLAALVAMSHCSAAAAAAARVREARASGRAAAALAVVAFHASSFPLPPLGSTPLSPGARLFPRTPMATPRSSPPIGHCHGGRRLEGCQ